MGTRNLTCVVKDKTFRVAQYCQWDGYPSGVGAEILDFLRDEFDKDLMEIRLDQLEPVDDEEMEKLWEEAGSPRGQEMVSSDTIEKMKAAYPQLVREFGPAVLGRIQEGTLAGNKVKLEQSFAQDSLFCEWAYVVDLDRHKFEVYRGLNTRPIDHTERFYTGNLPEYGYPGDEDRFYPVSLLIEFDLDLLPDKEAFVKACEAADEDRHSEQNEENEIEEAAAT